MSTDFGLTPVGPSDIQTFKVTSFEHAKKLRDEILWQQLEKTSIGQAIDYWLSTLSPRTMINYKSGLRKLTEFGLIEPAQTLQTFALLNHDALLDRIKLHDQWSECSRQARAACYVSFTKFLHRQTQGMIKRAVPNREGNAKTFFRVYEKVKTSAMTQAQWLQFFEALERLSPRECLIAKIILQGGKRVSEVLSLQTDQIDWERKKISFKQSKTKGLIKQTIITYSEGIMRQLRDYVGDRIGYVFVSRFGKPIALRWLAGQCAIAGKMAGIPFKVTPHVLRASTVTYLKKQGFADSEIMKVTGHANSAMVYAYDKSSRENNASERVNLVS
jgi:integrase